MSSDNVTYFVWKSAMTCLSTDWVKEICLQCAVSVSVSMMVHTLDNSSVCSNKNVWNSPGLQCVSESYQWSSHHRHGTSESFYTFNHLLCHYLSVCFHGPLWISLPFSGFLKDTCSVCSYFIHINVFTEITCRVLVSYILSDYDI